MDFSKGMSSYFGYVFCKINGIVILDIPQIHEDNAQNAVDEADHLMDMCDDDEDGKLSPQEIVNEADEWIESAGTEYGQTLRWMEDL